jgi:hypothetical protein
MELCSQHSFTELGGNMHRYVHKHRNTDILWILHRITIWAHKKSIWYTQCTAAVQVHSKSCFSVPQLKKLYNTQQAVTFPTELAGFCLLHSWKNKFYSSSWFLQLANAPKASLKAAQLTVAAVLDLPCALPLAVTFYFWSTRYLISSSLKLFFGINPPKPVDDENNDNGQNCDVEE